MPVLYTAGQYQKVVDKNKAKQTEFLSGERLDGLQKLFNPKGRAIRTSKSYSYKLLIEIGIQELVFKGATLGKTLNGYPKMTVTFYKNPTDSWFNNTNLAYHPIENTHLLMNESTGNIKSLWYKPFSRCLTKEDFKILPKRGNLKCIVLHREEPFLQHGQQMYYEQGNKRGQPIILLKPEIVKVFHIDTPDEDIEVNYFKLYKPYKR